MGKDSYEIGNRRAGALSSMRTTSNQGQPPVAPEWSPSGPPVPPTMNYDGVQLRFGIRQSRERRRR
jgi:hypothetical protein